MRRLRVALARMRALFQGDRLDRELTAELESHLAHHIDDNRRAGMNEADARRVALAKLGGIEQMRERHRDARSFAWLEDIRCDASAASRQLCHHRAFAVTAILILTVGIGLNLTIFQLLNVTLLRPVPVTDPDTLVRFDRVSKFFSSNGIPYPATQFIRHHNSVLAAVLTWHSADVVWEDDLSDRLRASHVSANWFEELGYQTQMGRLFAEAIDERADAAAVVVVSDTFWRTRLSRGSVVGRVVRINDRPATIIGVAPADVPGLRLEDPQVWLLIDQIDRFNPGTPFKDDWGSHNTQLYARLRSGLSAANAREGLRATSRALAVLHPLEFQPDEVLQPYSGREAFRSPRDRRERQTLAVLAVSLSLVILIVACANLSNMVLSRSITRLRELSVRAALGATRGRLLRQQLAESALLTVLGALGGLLLSRWGIRAAAAYTSLPAYLDFTPDWHLVTATCVVAALATAAIGLVPAWMVIRRDLITAMKDGGHQTSQGLARAPVRLLLVGAQVAGCSILLIVAGLMVRSVQRMLTTDRGFEIEQIAVLDPSLSRFGVQNAVARTYWMDVQRRLRASNPDVELALASQAPLGEGMATSKYNDAPGLVVMSLNVDASFFRLLRIPILAGRSFEPEDGPGVTVIISRRLAIEMYGTVDVVGKSFPRSAPGPTIVGVVADAPLANMTATRAAEQYAPIGKSQYGTVLLLARTSGNPERLLVPLRVAARAADGRVLPRTWLPSMELEQRVRERSMASLVALLVGALALSLSCFGIVGLVACGVSVRVKEIAIRRALGAERGLIVRLLLRQLLLPVGFGMSVGTIVGFSVARILEGEPFYLPSVDVTTLAGALGLFVLAAAVAVLAPVSRALRIDPLPALKHE